jgi:hypothetical protein
MPLLRVPHALYAAIMVLVLATLLAAGFLGPLLVTCRASDGRVATSLLLESCGAAGPDCCGCTGCEAPGEPDASPCLAAPAPTGGDDCCDHATMIQPFTRSEPRGLSSPVAAAMFPEARACSEPASGCGLPAPHIDLATHGPVPIRSSVLLI